MDFVGSMFAVMVVFILRDYTVNGLQCYRCSYNKLSTGNGIIDEALKVVTSKITSDDSCLLENENDVHNIPSRTCAPAADGTAKRCVVVKGKITITVNIVVDISVTYETLSRDCIDVDDDSEKQVVNNKCFQEEIGSNAAKAIIKDYFEGLDVKSFDGEACYFNINLGSELYPEGISDDRLGSMLQCYSCSANTIKTGQDIADKIINWVAKVANDKYCSLRGSSDKYNIASKTCAVPLNPDNIARCVALKGEMTIVLAGFNVLYQTLTRDCVEVVKTSEKAASNDKCYPEESKSSTFKKIVNDYFDGLQVSNFKGNACYYQKNLASEEEPEGALLTAAGQGRVTSVFGTIMIILCACII